MTRPAPIPEAVTSLLAEGERARPVAGASRYHVTDRGRVISTVRGPARVLRPWTSSRGYLQVCLVPDDREPGSDTVWKPSVHRLVARAYLPTPVPKPAVSFDVCHNDGRKTNNDVANLRYDEKSVNQQDTMRHGLRRGQVPGSGLTPVAVWTLRCRAQSEPVRELAREFASAYQVSERAVRMALHGQRVWRWIPHPKDGRPPEELARVLGVGDEEAAMLLALAEPERPLRMAA